MSARVNPQRLMIETPDVRLLAARDTRHIITLQADSVLAQLIALLFDPRVPDAYAESVRAELREIAYRMRLVAEQEAA